MKFSNYLMNGAVDLVGKGLDWHGKVWAAHRSLIRTNMAYESAMAAAGAHVFPRPPWSACSRR